MKFSLCQLNKAVCIVCFNFLIFFNISCGGGGGGSETASSSNTNNSIVVEVETPAVITEPSIDYSPDSEKLLSLADSSSDLFVDPNFAFNNHKQVTFDIDVTDIQDISMGNIILSISRIDKEIIEHDDPRLQDKSLLTKVKTDNNGQIYLNLEVPNGVDKVLLELNVLGIENDVILPVDTSGVVAHHFQ